MPGRRGRGQYGDTQAAYGELGEDVRRGRLETDPGPARPGLAPWTVGHSLAFLYGDGERADEAQTRAGHEAATYDRLAALKAVHDPRNLFRLNRNIRPAAAGAPTP